jgi:hypothetical protein
MYRMKPDQGPWPLCETPDIWRLLSAEAEYAATQHQYTGTQHTQSKRRWFREWLRQLDCKSTQVPHPETEK